MYQCAGAKVCPQILSTRSTSSPLLFSTSIISSSVTALSFPTPPGSLPTYSAIIGISLVGILVVIIITLLALAAVCLWIKRNHNKDFQLARNEAYGAGPQSRSTDDECCTTFYDYPTLDQEAINIAMEKNEAYATNVNMAAYVTNNSTEKNKAYEAPSPGLS